MTAQFSDPVEYKKKPYAIAGICGKGLFEPAAHGMKPVPKCTACWRGYVCSYAVEQALFLEQLSVCIEHPENPPKLFGMMPAPFPGEFHMFDLVYINLHQPVPFSGGLLLAADFIEELYVHMGFHPAWKYHTVHELIFREGSLVRESDRSGQMAELREKLRQQALKPGKQASREQVEKWIGECFSQTYSI
ncbi:MAG TPA: hypothetical protein VGN88_08890 [Phycisphaerae bacterium]|jgi:hypothetical protein